MKVPLKSGEEIEIPQEWIDEWNAVFYGVEVEVAKARTWLLDNPDKRKTKRGIRAFFGNWIRKSCAARPLEKPRSLIAAERVVIDVEKAKSAIDEMKRRLGK